MAPHSSILAWRTSGTEEPGGLPSMGLQRVGQDCSVLAPPATVALCTSLSLHMSRSPVGHKGTSGGGVSRKAYTFQRPTWWGGHTSACPPSLPGWLRGVNKVHFIGWTVEINDSSISCYISGGN